MFCVPPLWEAFIFPGLLHAWTGGARGFQPRVSWNWPRLLGLSDLPSLAFCQKGLLRKLLSEMLKFFPSSLFRHVFSVLCWQVARKFQMYGFVSYCSLNVGLWNKPNRNGLSWSLGFDWINRTFFWVPRQTLSPSHTRCLNKKSSAFGTDLTGSSFILLSFCFFLIAVERV